MAAPAAPAGPAGKAEIKELVHDAGTVERGTEIVHTFTITNVGEHDLTVDAKAGCGCTVAEFDKVIAKGATGKVKATVATTNFKGPIAKSITVTTNDPANARITLQMKANVTVPVDVQPSENVAFNGKAGALAPQRITLTATDGKPFDVTAVTPKDSNFTATVAAAPEAGVSPPAGQGTAASGAARYEVTITPSADVPVGRISSGVTVTTTHPKAGEISVRIFGTVTGEVEVVPQYVTVATGPTATPEAKVQHVAIKKPTGDPLTILSVTPENPAIKTTLVPVTEGREYDLKVEYTGEAMTTALTTKINVKTDDARQKSLDIQVWGRPDPGTTPVRATAMPPTSLRPAATATPVALPAQAPPSP